MESVRNYLDEIGSCRTDARLVSRSSLSLGIAMNTMISSKEAKLLVLQVLKENKDQSFRVNKLTEKENG